MLEKPEDFVLHIQRFSNSVVTSVVYGRRVPRYDDPEVLEIFEVL